MKRRPKSMRRIFYVYLITDPTRDYEPIYVGKGHNSEFHERWRDTICKSLRSEHNLFLGNRLNKIIKVII